MHISKVKFIYILPYRETQPVQTGKAVVQDSRSRPYLEVSCVMHVGGSFFEVYVTYVGCSGQCARHTCRAERL